MKARVHNGRWVFDDPTDLPEGTEVEIVTRVVRAAGDVYLDDKLRDYVRALLAATGSPKYSSARGGTSPQDESELVEAAKARARTANRAYTTPDDIKKAAPDILRRLVSVPAGLKSRYPSTDDAIRAILDETPLP